MKDGEYHSSVQNSEEGNHGSSFQSGNDSDSPRSSSGTYAGPEARGTETTTISDESCEEDDDRSQDSLEFLNPKCIEIPIYTREELNTLRKGQLVDYAQCLQFTLHDVQRSYENLLEIARKERTIQYVNSSDKITSLIKRTDERIEENKVKEAEDKKGCQRSEEQSKPRGRPKRRKGHKEGKNQGLPVVKVSADFSEEEKNRLFGDHKYQLIKTVRFKENRVIPSRVYVEEHVAFVYKDLETGKIFQSAYAKDFKFLPGSDLTTDLLAYIADSYYGNSIPVNRLVDMLGREGFDLLTKQEVYKWLRDYGKKCIVPVVSRMTELVLQRDVIQSDETFIKSIEEMQKSGRKHCFFWLIRTSELDHGTPPILVATFVETRSAEELKKIIGDYEGKMECDGYSVYPALTKEILKLVIVCCLNHVRHQFVNAVKALPKALPEEKLEDIPSYQILKMIGEIFREDSLVKHADRDVREKARKETLHPEVLKLQERLLEEQKKPNFDPKSAFGKAVVYGINRMPFVLAGIDDPDVPLDNSACERFFIKSALLRNNSKAFSTSDGAACATNYLSVGETCRQNNVNPALYYRYCFEKIPNVIKAHQAQYDNHDLSFLDDHLPWGKEFQKYAAESLKREKDVLDNLLSNLVTDPNEDASGSQAAAM